MTFESDFVDRGNNPGLHLHMGMLASVLDLLNSESRCFRVRTNRGCLTTPEETIF